MCLAGDKAKIAAERFVTANEIAELRHRDAFEGLGTGSSGSGRTKAGDDGCAANVLA